MLTWILGASLAFAGCSSDSDSGTRGGESAFQELYDQGLTKYVGMFPPVAESDAVEGVKTHSFDVPSDLSAEPRGPLCLRGTEYTIDTREGSSDELVIFLQGGGACWAEFCSAFEETNSLPPAGILNPSLVGNPVADWDVVYLPYCDGSLFAGDVDRMLPNSILNQGGPAESMGYQRGLQNLTAALDIAVGQFPDPPRILLTGVSGGAFGTIAALPLVRYYYPATEILVFNDSGIGVAKEGDTEFIEETLLAGWNADSLVPVSCPDCTSNGHATRLVEWQLAADDNVTMSGLSFSADFVISVTFLMISPDDFTSSLLAETERMTTNFPDRYKRFIPAGAAHTTLLRETSDGGGGVIQIGTLETEVGGVTVLDWFTAMIDGTDSWTNQVDDTL
jgi:hypothetical protein